MTLSVVEAHKSSEHWAAILEAWVAVNIEVYALSRQLSRHTFALTHTESGPT
jgi:hypothetical protein